MSLAHRSLTFHVVLIQHPVEQVRVLRREYNRDVSRPHLEDGAREYGILCSLSCSFVHLQPADALTKATGCTSWAAFWAVFGAMASAPQHC